MRSLGEGTHGPRRLLAGLTAPRSAWPPTAAARTQHAIITVLLPGSRNEGCRVPAIITAWLKRTGAASKPNYKVCSRTPSCPVPFLWGWLEGGTGEFTEKPVQAGTVVLGEWRAHSLGLCCFEKILAPPSAPPLSKFPSKAKVRNGQRNQLRLLFQSFHQNSFEDSALCAGSGRMASVEFQFMGTDTITPILLPKVQCLTNKLAAPSHSQ